MKRHIASSNHAHVRWSVVVTNVLLAIPASAFAAEPGDATTAKRVRADGGQASGAHTHAAPSRRDGETGPSAVFGSPPPGANATTNDFVSTELKDFGADESITCTACSVSTSIPVAGLPDKIWDVDVTVMIQHSWNSDLGISLAGPGGTIALSDHRGFNGSNGFLNKRFDDSANGLVTESVGAGPLVPEGSLSTFFGRNPNTTWSLLISDGYCGVEDTECSHLQGWTLHITTLDSALGTSTVQATDANPAPIPNPGIVTSTITIAGAEPSLCDVNLTTGITHDWCGDLKISLTSPAGTTVMLGSGNGSSANNLFNGTVWDDQATNLVSQGGFTNNQTATPLVGEGKLAKFIGEDPNGIWTLTVEDLTDVHPPPIQGPNSGTLQSWSLELTSCMAQKPGEAYCFGDGLDPVVTASCPCTNFGAANHGCGNSIFPNGALLTATGQTNPNTILFTMTGVPNNNLATGFRNITNVNPGGVVFGDGVRCQSGALIRFSSHNIGTFGDLPNSWSSNTDTLLPGLTRYYQVQYRNPAPAFCPPATFNISNGYRITW